MANNIHNTVQVAVTSSSKHLEGILAVADAFPGFLVERTNNRSTFRPHSTAQGVAQPLIVIENIYEGKTFVGNNTGASDPYYIGEHIYIRYARPGDVFLCVAGAAVNFGAFIASNGAGRFITATGSHLGKALTAAAVNGDFFEVEML